MHSHMVDIKIDFGQLSGLAEKKSLSLLVKINVLNSLLSFFHLFSELLFDLVF